jgi:hypothetical protein
VQERVQKEPVIQKEEGMPPPGTHAAEEMKDPLSARAETMEPLQPRMTAKPNVVRERFEHLQETYLKEPRAETGLEKKAEELRVSVPGAQPGGAPGSNILEEGLIYFFYRPRIGLEHVQDVRHAGKLYILLAPGASDERPVANAHITKRLLICGRKKMPSIDQKERNFCHVKLVTTEIDKVKAKLAAKDKRVGERIQHKDIARPCGEGIYCITEQDDISYLAYWLSAPAEPGPVQNAFNIVTTGSYVIALRQPIRNERGPHPTRQPIELQRELIKETSLSKEQQIYGRKWAKLRLEGLQIEGTEILLAGAFRGVEKLGNAAAELKRRHREESRKYVSEILERDLRMRWERVKDKVQPLAAGLWV